MHQASDQVPGGRRQAERPSGAEGPRERFRCLRRDRLASRITFKEVGVRAAPPTWTP